MIDDSLEPEVRDLLAAGRDRMGPDPATIARLRSRIDHAVSAGVPAATSSVVPKLVIVVALGVVGTGLYLRSSQLPVPAASPPVTTIDLEPASAPSVQLIVREVAVVDSSAATPQARTRLEPARAVDASAVAASAVTASLQPPPIAMASLAREIELIDRASYLVQRGQARAALDILSIYDSETAGRGQLAQDAAALDVEIRCRAADPTALDQLAAFDQRWPHSAQRQRLGSVCKTLADRR